jgi:phosphotransferase system  glucose/maltose/N-acetylglucosamine-specific IIC component
VNNDDFKDTIIIIIGLWLIAAALDLITWGPFDIFINLIGGFLRPFIR